MKNAPRTSHTDGSFLGYHDGTRVVMVTFTEAELEGIFNVLGPNKSIASWIHTVVKERVEELGAMIGEDYE